MSYRSDGSGNIDTVDGDGMQFRNVTDSYGNHASPESNYNGLVYGVQNDGIIGIDIQIIFPCGIFINSICQIH